MPARTEKPDHRWRFNNSGQLVDSEAAPAGWELADEIVRLKIGDVAADPADIIPLRTPPKSHLSAAAVMGTDSPLDAVSIPSAGSSPQSLEHHIAHSRASSIDTTNSSSHESVSSGRRLNQPASIRGNSVANGAKGRPRSFSGGLSSGDLHRLQHAGQDEFTDRQQQWYQATNQEAPAYPSLSNHVHRPQPQQHPALYDPRNGADRDEHQIDYIQSRNYNHAPPPHPSFVTGPPANGMPYRQNSRGFPQQGVAPGSSSLPYPAHASHLSLGNTQHLYDMMLPAPMHDNHPAVTRVQQQHNVFRATHHHSASDPSNLRDAATMALLNNTMPPTFAPAMFQPGMPPMMYPNQYYGQDVAQQIMAARLQAQYTGPYNMPAARPLSVDNTGASPTTDSNESGGQAPGPSANNRKLGLYKTELCRSWEEKHSCRYGAKCQFAHGEEELRNVSRHPKYKTEICRTFWVSGSCPYGKRCCFIHTELPNAGTGGATPPSGVPSGADSSTSQPDGRARSMSTNSDPNDATTSLLARIKSNAAGSTPIDAASSNNFQFGSRPPTGSLRVDTSALDGPSIQKQNKSAYPTFASNGILLPAPEPIRARSPAPVTAGPDLGRYNAAARLEIVGLNGQQGPKKGHATGNPRHSFSGEVDLGFAPSPSTATYEMGNGPSANGASGNGMPGRVNGHVRAGSAGNWGSLVRSNLVNTSFGRGSHSPAGDIMSAHPWSGGEVAALRLNEKAWA
ncbi:hypothetical protein D9611_003205 [Ephemerocybe angulata]|uniref:C3H1-type domain-containing protein n=1 Tax=Ephemerocybe angulata TaxID=980116 RepID=A0A8H5C8Q8_9AGAR|nr:hypothetical protein D9611_003205 [Tulosesus angulatus]